MDKVHNPSDSVGNGGCSTEVLPVDILIIGVLQSCRMDCKYEPACSGISNVAIILMDAEQCDE
jgi:hypothetical protein